jgi:hypothetical protein
MDQARNAVKLDQERQRGDSETLTLFLSACWSIVKMSYRPLKNWEHAVTVVPALAQRQQKRCILVDDEEKSRRTADSMLDISGANATLVIE